MMVESTSSKQTARFLLSTIFAIMLLPDSTDSLPLAATIRGDVANALTLPESLSLLQPAPAELRQFIGSSVIGGLMWPVLVTLALTAMMARVPDIFQRILGGSGGLRSFDAYDPRLNLLLAGPDGSSVWEDKLEEALRIFERATRTFDGMSP